MYPEGHQTRPIKMGSQGGSKYFYPDQMRYKPMRDFSHKEYRAVQRKRQRSYNRYLCAHYETE